MKSYLFILLYYYETFIIFVFQFIKNLFILESIFYFLPKVNRFILLCMLFIHYFIHYLLLKKL